MFCVYGDAWRYVDYKSARPWQMNVKIVQPLGAFLHIHKCQGAFLWKLGP